MTGARQARSSLVHRLVSCAFAFHARAFVVPEAAIAAGQGLDLEAAGLELVATPRHASILVVVDDLPPEIARAAAVVYAHMPRPRWIMAIGSHSTGQLPAPDIAVEPDQSSVEDGVRRLRRLMRTGAFGGYASDFVADQLVTRRQYTCPMHPDIVQDEPGTCPKCGMDLVLQESAGEPNAHHHHHAEHDEVSGADRGHHAHMDHQLPAESEHGHVGPEHGGEVLGHERSMEHHGGMEGSGHEGHAGHGEDMGHGAGHEGHGDMEGGFMSMVAMTKDMPRSPDGLAMEWVEAPFGPLFPALPAGLNVVLTLDGDAVASARIDALDASITAVADLPCSLDEFPNRLSRLDRLAPDAYRVLGWRALADAGVAEWNEGIARYAALLLERQRITSHIVWLSRIGTLLGIRWLARDTLALAAQLRRETATGDGSTSSSIEGLVSQVRRTPLLKRRLAGIGCLTAEQLKSVAGPNRRAGGEALDARTTDALYESLGFSPAHSERAHALGRLDVRLDEILESLRMIGDLEPAARDQPQHVKVDHAQGRASIETPRGPATVSLVVRDGVVFAADIATPTARNLQVAQSSLMQLEVADALLTIASLDLSPWEVGL